MDIRISFMSGFERRKKPISLKEEKEGREGEKGGGVRKGLGRGEEEREEEKRREGKRRKEEERERKEEGEEPSTIGRTVV